MFDELKEELKAEAYLEPKQASMMDLICENNERLKVVNYFRKIIDL